MVISLGEEAGTRQPLQRGAGTRHAGVTAGRILPANEGFRRILADPGPRIVEKRDTEALARVPEFPGRGRQKPPHGSQPARPPRRGGAAREGACPAGRCGGRLFTVIRIGVAGWDYKDWWGTVYPKPPPRGFDPLAFLAGYFDSVEVNSTFYRPMAARTARDWCRRVAHNRRFRFTAKLWQRFTHEREAAFTGEDVRQAREALEALAGEDRLGAVLMQFPWSFKREEASREWLADVVRAMKGLPLVLEVRHASWNVPELYQSLAEQGVGFVNIDQPLFHGSLRPSAVATARVGYIRIHGRNYGDWFRQEAGRDERYDYLYTARELEPWAERARTLESEGVAGEIYVVTNNHFRGQEVANAAMLRSMIERRRVRVPPALFGTFGEVLAPYVEVA